MELGLGPSEMTGRNTFYFKGFENDGGEGFLARPGVDEMVDVLGSIFGARIRRHFWHFIEVGYGPNENGKSPWPGGVYYDPVWLIYEAWRGVRAFSHVIFKELKKS